MTTAEAAAKWAEAKDLLESALGALRAATAAHESAYAAEREAWEALETLAGRGIPVAVPSPPTAYVASTREQAEEFRRNNTPEFMRAHGKLIG